VLQSMCTTVCSLVTLCLCTTACLCDELCICVHLLVNIYWVNEKLAFLTFAISGEYVASDFEVQAHVISPLKAN
jgi:hypothetical protein